MAEHYSNSGGDASARLRTLRRLNRRDLVQALGVQTLVDRFPVLAYLLDLPATRMARYFEEFDQTIAARGLRAAGAGLLARLGMKTVVRGEPVVEHGPRLYLANHPGIGDTLALFSRLGDPDVKIVGRDRPFLRALPQLARRLMYVPETGGLRVVREMEAHLKQGGGILTFPAGTIEPDPAWSDPTESWSHWSESPQVLARRVPGLQVQPVLVSGVILPEFVDPWAARFRKTKAERELTAAAFQVGWTLYRASVWLRPVTLTFGRVLTGTDWSLKDEMVELWMQSRR